MKKRRKGIQVTAPQCPYCGSRTVLRSADGIYQSNLDGAMLYVCKNYPSCDAYVRAHLGSNLPMGIPANWQLRRLRNEAHHYFDQLYKSGYMTRKDAYTWLASTLGLPESEAHIGYFGEHYCHIVIEESKKMLGYKAAVRKDHQNRCGRRRNHHESDRTTAAHC